MWALKVLKLLFPNRNIPVQAETSLHLPYLIRYMLRFCLYFFLFLFPIISFGQKETAIWYFGNGDGLDFNKQPPLPIRGPMITDESCASICDPDGKLLFYTNGEVVWNRQHNQMLNGAGLWGNVTSSQGVIIVRQPLNPNKYYIFTTVPCNTLTGVSYSIVDITGDGGKGEVIVKNKRLIWNWASEYLAATLHANGKDVWIVTRRCEKEEFYSFLLTENYVSITPIISKIGQEYTERGQMKISPDGRLLGITSKYLDNIHPQLFVFNNSTGTVDSLVATLRLGDREKSYGLEFSPNSRFLYVGTRHSTQENYKVFTSRYYQYDCESLNDSLINSTRFCFFVDSIQTDFVPYGFQLALDRKIYVAQYYKYSTKTNLTGQINIIVNADSLKQCSVVEKEYLFFHTDSFPLGMLLSFPNALSSYYDPIYQLDLGANRVLCKGDSVELNLYYPRAEYIWSNGSTDSSIWVKDAGWYKVKVVNPNVNKDIIDSVFIQFIECSYPCDYYRFTISPNPNSGDFTLQFQDYFSGAISVYNIVGQKVLQLKLVDEISVNYYLSAVLVPGVYTIAFQKDNCIRIEKFVVVK